MDYWTARYEEECDDTHEITESISISETSVQRIIPAEPPPPKQMTLKEFFEGLGALLAVFEHLGKASNKGYMRTKARLNTT